MLTTGMATARWPRYDRRFYACAHEARICTRTPLAASADGAVNTPVSQLDGV